MEKGTYVSVKVVNYYRLLSFYQEQSTGINEDLHCTIAYSQNEFYHKPCKTFITIKPEDFIGIEKFDGAIVLTFKSDELHKRHKKCLEEGASYDYPSYIPHIAITYDVTDNTDFKLPDFNIILGAEEVEELDEE